MFDYFEEKLDIVIEALGEVLKFMLDSLLWSVDQFLWLLTQLANGALQIGLFFFPDQIFNDIITKITDADDGLFYLLDTITMLALIVDINTVLGTFALGFTVTLGALLYKLVLKLVPFIG